MNDKKTALLIALMFTPILVFADHEEVLITFLIPVIESIFAILFIAFIRIRGFEKQFCW